MLCAFFYTTVSIHLHNLRSITKSKDEAKKQCLCVALMHLNCLSSLALVGAGISFICVICTGLYNNSTVDYFISFVSSEKQ